MKKQEIISEATVLTRWQVKRVVHCVLLGDTRGSREDRYLGMIMCELVYGMETPCENPSTVIAKEMCRHVKGSKVSYLLSFGTFLFLENRKKTWYFDKNP